MPKKELAFEEVISFLENLPYSMFKQVVDRYSRATGYRFAVLCDNETDAKLIFTRTFGMITDIRMDINAWLNGEDFEERETSLLYALNAGQE